MERYEQVVVFLTEERAPAVLSRLSTGARRPVCIKCTRRLARPPRVDTLTDTLRSGRPCDLWTPLEAKGGDLLKKQAILDASGHHWTA